MTLFEDSFDFTDIIRSKIAGLQLGVLEVNNFLVNKNSDLVRDSFDDLFYFVKNKFDPDPPSSDPIVSAVRRMYRRIGWEPTRYRPSSEAMLRRIIKGNGLYHINNAVDLGNVASARYHIPMGLYDLEKINRAITCDVGRKDEAYQGLSKELIHADGKLILRDQSGIFGNPTADSRRTCIANTTKAILAVFFSPPEVTRKYLLATLDYLSRLYQQECDAVVENYIVICD